MRTGRDVQWGAWLGVWLVTLLAGGVCTTIWAATWLALVASSPGSFDGSLPPLTDALRLFSFERVWRFTLLAAPFVVIPIPPMTVCAVALRWLWLRFAAPEGGDTVRSQVMIGGLAGGISLPLIGLFSLGDQPSVLSDYAMILWIASPLLATPLILGGAGAGYLAHRRAWPTERGWYAILVSVSMAGGLVAAIVTWLAVWSF